MGHGWGGLWGVKGVGEMSYTVYGGLLRKECVVMLLIGGKML